MRQKNHSEARRRYDLLFHAPRRHHLAHYKTSLGDLSKAAEQRNGRTRRAELDAMHSKDAFTGAQNEVGPLWARLCVPAQLLRLPHLQPVSPLGPHLGHKR